MTENLFRFEYSSSGTFENRATLAVVNRNMTLEKSVAFQHFEQDGKLFILTAKFNISYVVGSGIKAPDDLRVVSLDPNEVYNGDSGLVWQYGMTSENDAGNLLGMLENIKQFLFLLFLNLKCSDCRHLQDFGSDRRAFSRLQTEQKGPLCLWLDFEKRLGAGRRF